MARQPVKVGNGNIPYHRHHAQYINGGYPGGSALSALFVSMSLNPLWSRSLNFLGKFCKIHDFWGSAVTAQGLAVNQSSGGEKSCIVYGWICILIIIITVIIISSSSSISISFVV